MVAYKKHHPSLNNPNTIPITLPLVTAVASGYKAWSVRNQPSGSSKLFGLVCLAMFIVSADTYIENTLALIKSSQAN